MQRNLQQRSDQRLCVLQRSPATRCTLLYGNRTAGSTMFKEELEDLKNRYLTRLALHPVFCLIGLAMMRLGYRMLYEHMRARISGSRSRWGDQLHGDAQHGAADPDATGRRKLPFFVDPIDGRLKIERGTLMEIYMRCQVEAERAAHINPTRLPSAPKSFDPIP